MNYEFELDKQGMAFRQQQIENLKRNPVIERFLRQYDLDVSFIEKNCGTLSLWIENLSLCSGCAGLNFCRQKIKGKTRELYIDESHFLSERFVSCNYLKEMDKKVGHKKNYRLSHLSNDEVLIDLYQFDLSKESQAYLIAYQKMLMSLNSDKGIYLYGQPGVGKSYMMIGACNVYAKNGMQVSYVNVPRLIQDLKQSMAEIEYRQQVLSHLRHSDVLFMDDMGSEWQSVWTRDEIIFPILEFRMTHHKKTYFSSNYTLEELQNQYQINDRVASLRLVERIKALCEVVSLQGVSRR